jgi:hypothetical protein
VAQAIEERGATGPAAGMGSRPADDRRPGRSHHARHARAWGQPSPGSLRELKRGGACPPSRRTWRSSSWTLQKSSSNTSFKTEALANPKRMVMLP